jgi:hypothetical protein
MTVSIFVVYELDWPVQIFKPLPLVTEEAPGCINIIFANASDMNLNDLANVGQVIGAIAVY